MCSKLPPHPSVPRDTCGCEACEEKRKRKIQTGRKEKTRAARTPPLFKLPPPTGAPVLRTRSSFPEVSLGAGEGTGICLLGTRMSLVGTPTPNHDPGYKPLVRGTSHPRSPRRRGETTGDHGRVTGLHSTSCHTRRGIAVQPVQVRMDNSLCLCGLPFPLPLSPPGRGSVVPEARATDDGNQASSINILPNRARPRIRLCGLRASRQLPAANERIHTPASIVFRAHPSILSYLRIRPYTTARVLDGHARTHTHAPATVARRTRRLKPFTIATRKSSNCSRRASYFALQPPFPSQPLPWKTRSLK